MRSGSLIAFLASLLSLASLVLIALNLAGSTNQSVPSKDIFMIKIDFSEVSTDVLPELDTMSSTDKSNITTIKYYTVGLWSYCYWSSEDSIADCSKPSSKYYFSLDNIVYDRIGHSTTVTSPGRISQDANRIKTYCQASIVLFLVAVAAIIFGLFMGIISIFRYRTSKIIASVVMLIASISSLIAAGMIFSIYSFINTEFKNANLSISSSRGQVMNGLLIGLIISTFLGFFVMVIASCKAPRRPRSGIPEQQPFLGNVPLHPVASSYSDATSYNSSHNISPNPNQYGQSMYYDPTNVPHTGYHR